MPQEENNTNDGGNSISPTNGISDQVNQVANLLERGGSVSVANQRIRIPAPRSLGQFILAPGRWKMPNLSNTRALYHRIKTNLLYFQTNYLICGTVMFFGLMILSMRTLLTGVVSAIILTIAGLFFFEHIPQARRLRACHFEQISSPGKEGPDLLRDTE